MQGLGISAKRLSIPLDEFPQDRALIRALAIS